MNIAVIGAANIDITARPSGKFVPYDSNPGFITESLGGVGRNIAHNLALLGQDVTFLTALGGDTYAARITESCHSLGIRLSHALYCPDMASSVYLSVNDDHGDLVAGVNDMALCDKISAEYVRNNLNFLSTMDAVVFDTNLTEETMAMILSCCTVPLYVDAVSQTKAKKLASILQGSDVRLHTLKANRHEAAVLGNGEIRDLTDAKDCAKILLNRGVERVYLTLGADGVLASDQEETIVLPCPNTKIVNTTGSGDSFLAALVFARSLGYGVRESAMLGQAAAKITLESENAVSEKMSADALLNSLKNNFLSL